ncbi:MULTISPECIES: YdiU family protein [unclassified Agrococcus]|uniref:protein adenylyltransferase SelO n=1 Tax=unclassified Agrococcus TaxID=2615065 RepID=UPI003613C4F1
MGPAPQSSIALERGFARDLPEMAIPWRAAEAPAARLLVLNERLATELGLDPASLRSPEGVRMLTGADVPAGAEPVAQVYAGHQFGTYSPRLGDGRALLLGELRTADDRLVDLHLKGSGRTPLARAGDGLAAVGPMLREHLVSEAMHALGIPTTRSLAVVATGRPVQRDTLLPGAVLARVASSHLRVGSVQHARATGDEALLRRLVDHTIRRHHPDLVDAEAPAHALLDRVVAAQASLVAQWMLVGFVHGVMNTDNMTLSGETIDYGPCAFMDAFDPQAVYSSIDVGGRYAYGNQPGIAAWNLARLAEALLPVLDDDPDAALAKAQASLNAFGPAHARRWREGMLAKLGLPAETDAEVASALVGDLADMLHAARADHTSSFRALTFAARGDERRLRALLDDAAGLDAWVRRWLALGPDAAAMAASNPVVIPRNHLVEEALAAATEGDLAPFERLLDAVTQPFVDRPGFERYAEPAPEAFGAYRTYCGT